MGWIQTFSGAEATPYTDTFFYGEAGKDLRNLEGTGDTRQGDAVGG